MVSPDFEVNKAIKSMVVCIITAKPLQVFVHARGKTVGIPQVKGAIGFVVRQNIKPVFVLLSGGVVQATVRVLAQFILRTIGALGQ